MFTINERFLKGDVFMKAFDAWLNKEFKKALENPKRFIKQQKVLTAIGLLIVAIVMFNILNIL